MDETSLRQALRELREPDLLPDPTLAAKLRRRHDRRRHAVPVVVAGLGVAVAAAAVPLVERSDGTHAPTSLAGPAGTAPPSPTTARSLPPLTAPRLPADDLLRSLGPLPSEGLLASPELGRDILYVQQVLYNRCFEAAGLPRAPVTTRTVQPRTQRLWGPTSLALALDDGYGTGDFYGGQADPPPGPSYSRAQMRVIYGPGGGEDPDVRPPASSCFATTNVAIYGDPDPDLVGLLNATSQAGFAEADHGVGTANVRAAYSACMRSRGLPYDTWGEASNAVSDSHAPDAIPVSAARERSVAVSDVTCKQRTGFVPAMWQAHARGETAYLDTVPRQLAQVHGWLEHAKRATGEVIAEELGD